MIKNWLDIQPAPLTGVSLYESLPFEMRAAEGLLWYRGNAAELNQFYMQTANDKTVRARFWATPTSGNVRKLHSGLPAIIIDTLAYLVKNDLDQVDFLNDEGKDVWEELNARPEFQFPDIVGAGIVGALSSGDGAWKISIDKAVSPYDALLAGYTTALDLCLQGIVSPATLGIDIGKMSSADAQREKKDVTAATRNSITGKLEVCLPQLIAAVLMTHDLMCERTVGHYTPTVSFGEYGAPDFDSRVETVTKAAAGITMSIETQVDELWGSSKDDDWKAEEVRRIKHQRGIETVTEPRVGEQL